MVTFLSFIFKYKQVKTYNIFSSLEDIKQMIFILKYCLDSVDSHLAHVEGFLVSDSISGDLTDPLIDHGEILL